jgi:hypothetical protein
MTNREGMRYKYTALLRTGAACTERTFFANTSWIKDGAVYFGGNTEDRSWFRIIGLENLMDLVEEDLKEKQPQSTKDLLTSILGDEKHGQPYLGDEHPVLKDEHATILPTEHK